MTISQTQLVDILYKKLSGVSKTDTSTAKSPANEANASPQLSPGTTIWQQDYYIPTVTTLPASNSSVVTVYRDTLSSTVQAVALSEGTAQETWATNLTDWISPQFGAGYQLQLFAGPPGKSNPQSLVNLPVGGSGNSDSWYFDYSAGIVNFADTNVPTPVANVANVVYAVGARYTGTKGINNFANLQIGSVTINGNTITGNTGVTFGGNITGNITGNVTGTILTPAQPYITTVGTLGNLTVTSNVSTGNLLVNGFFWGNGNPVVFSNYGNANVVTLLSSFGSNSISTTGNIVGQLYGNVHTDYISGNAGNVISFTGTGAIALPVGTAGQEPVGSAGLIRFNSTTSSVEFYDGSGWVSVVNAISNQRIYPDGIASTFTLNYTATSNSILVSVNGVLQQPDLAYTVSGNQITFYDVPGTTDTIDVRFISITVTQSTNLPTIIDSTPTVVTVANTIVDSFSSATYRSAKYLISSTTASDAHTAEILLTQFNSVPTITVYGVTNTGSNGITYYANVNGGTINLLAKGTTSSNIRVQTTYFSA
jgi:hypothetical protein